MSICPSLDDLNRLLADEQGDSTTWVAAHVETCRPCQDRLDALTALAQVTDVRETREDRPSAEFLRRLKSARAAGWSEAVGAGLHEVGQRLGPYEIVRELGHGGMGVVYLAYDPRVKRQVAVKMLRMGPFSTPAERGRFQAEAEVVARLQHPHIVPLYEIGAHEEHPYLVLEYVDGGSLADKLTGTPQDPSTSARLIETLARAIHIAHRRHIVHRDLKPGNILLQDGTFEHPRITDFGLAKQIEADQRPTESGSVLGTPSYMAPEQAAGRMQAISPQTDIYALGAMLYELLTGRPPFQGTTPLSTINQVVNQEPLPPSQLQRHLARDLETICLKCLAKRPERRYVSATALAEDLRRFLDRRPILARPVGPLEKLARWGRRNPPIAASLAGVGGVFLAAFLLVSWSYWRAEDARRVAENNEKAERWERYRANLVAAGSAMQLHNVSAARQALESAPEEHRNWEWRHFHHQLDAAQHVMGGKDAFVNRVFFTPDGGTALACGDRTRLWDVIGRKQLRTIDGVFGSGDPALSPNGKTLAIPLKDNAIELRDVATDRIQAVLRGHDKRVTAVYFSPVEDLLASGSEDRTIRLWSVTTGKELHVLRGHKGTTGRLSFSADGRQIVSSGGRDRTARLWETNTGRSIAVLSGHEQEVTEVGISPRGDRLSTVEYYPSNAVRLWDAATGKLIGVLRGHLNQVTWAAFSPDGTRFATSSGDQTVRLWDSGDGKLLATLQGHTGWVNHAAFSLDGTRLVSASQDQTVRLWDTATGAAIAVLHGHTRELYRVAYTANGALIVSVSGDGSVRLWDRELVERSGVLRGHTNFVYGVAFHPDGERVASVAWDGTVRIWNATTGRQILTFTYPEKTMVSSVAFHPAGRMLATIGRDNAVRLWDVRTGAEIHHWSLPTADHRDTRLAFGKQGDLLASGSQDGAIRLWDVNSRAEIAVLRGQGNQVRDVAFSPDGAWLASACQDRSIRIWNLGTKEQVHVLQGHTNPVYSLAFNADGKLLASGSTDGTVRLWDTTTWKEIAVLKHGSNVYGVAFTPDGTRLASACANNTIRFWDVATHKEVAELHGHGDYVHQIAFSPDGTRLVSGSGDFTVRIWDSLSAQERATIEQAEGGR